LSKSETRLLKLSGGSCANEFDPYTYFCELLSCEIFQIRPKVTGARLYSDGLRPCSASVGCPMPSACAIGLPPTIPGPSLATKRGAGRTWGTDPPSCWNSDQSAGPAAAATAPRVATAFAGAAFSPAGALVPWSFRAPCFRLVGGWARGHSPGQLACHPAGCFAVVSRRSACRLSDSFVDQLQRSCSGQLGHLQVLAVTRHGYVAGLDCSLHPARHSARLPSCHQGGHSTPT